MKKILLLSLFLFCIGIVKSQIPNTGFENWSGGVPDGWLPINGTTYIQQDANAHSGNWAVRFQTVGTTNSTFATRTPTNGFYFPLGAVSRPTAVQFYAITDLIGGDVLNVNVTFKQGANIVGVINGQCVSTNSSTYQLYSFPVLYNPPTAIPDSVTMWFKIHNGGCSTFSNQVRSGTFAIIDDISYAFTTATNPISKNEFLTDVFPNPVKDVLHILCKIKNPGMIDIQLCDMSGSVIKEIESTPVLPGAPAIRVETTGIVPGIYFLYIRTSEEFSARKVLIQGEQ